MLPETSTLVGTYKHRETLIHVERPHMLATYKHSDRQFDKTWRSEERRRYVCFNGLPTPGEMSTELGIPKHFPQSHQTLCEEKTNIIHCKSYFSPQLSTPVPFCRGDSFHGTAFLIWWEVNCLPDPQALTFGDLWAVRCKELTQGKLMRVGNLIYSLSLFLPVTTVHSYCKCMHSKW